MPLRRPSPRRTKPHPMRRISNPGEVDAGLLARVSYKPHPQHCGPPYTYAPHKTKCPDGMDCNEALGLLREGLRRSMVPPGNGLPPSVWAVDDGTGIVYEARLTNSHTAEYHGFPVLETDPLLDAIIQRWHERA